MMSNANVDIVKTNGVGAYGSINANSVSIPTSPASTDGLTSGPSSVIQGYPLRPDSPKDHDDNSHGKVCPNSKGEHIESGDEFVDSIDSIASCKHQQWCTTDFGDIKDFGSAASKDKFTRGMDERGSGEINDKNIAQVSEVEITEDIQLSIL